MGKNLIMKISEFVNMYNLQPADAINVKKDFYGLLNHYLVYLGQDYWGEHIFMANYTKGTRVLSKEDLMQFASYMHPVRISRFLGSEFEREQAVERALELKDEDSYHLILNNCEHFKNHVQLNKKSSDQTKVFGAGLAATGIVTAATSKSDGGKAAGMIMAGLGLLTLFLDSIED